MNRSLAAQYLQHLLDSTEEAEVCMGIAILSVDSLPQDVDILIPFLKKPSLAIARSAANSIALIADKHSVRYAPTLLTQLEIQSDTEIRQSCLRALGKMGDSFLVRDIIARSIHLRPNERRLAETLIVQMGLKTVPSLTAALKDVALPESARILAGRALGSLALPQLRSVMYGILRSEIERASFYLYHYYTIQKEYLNNDLTILQKALLSSFHSFWTSSFSCLEFLEKSKIVNYFRDR